MNNLIFSSGYDVYLRDYIFSLFINTNLDSLGLLNNSLYILYFIFSIGLSKIFLSTFGDYVASIYNSNIYSYFATPIIEVMYNVHREYYIIMTAILVLILYIIFREISSFRNIEYRYSVLNSFVLELLWSILPALIILHFMMMTIALLYVSDEHPFFGFHVKVIGHQWYWGALFNLLVVVYVNRYVMLFDLNVKASDLTRGANRRVSVACQKRGLKEWFPSYVGHGEVNESLSDKGGSTFPSSFYVRSQVFPSDETYKQPYILSKSITNVMRHLNLKSDEIKNSGCPERRKSGGYGGIVVRMFSTKIGKCKMKGPSQQTDVESVPTGTEDMSKLKWLVDNATEGTHVENITSDIFTADILRSCYYKLKSKPGMMTGGVGPITLDSITDEWFDYTYKRICTGEFKFSPVRRVAIPKASGGTRYLGVPSPRDRIVQEYMRIILEVIFEGSFEANSHGFRPGRGCFTALRDIKLKMKGVTWFIEGDISKCFDRMDHSLIMGIIHSKIKDQVFTDLIYKALKAGYIDLLGGKVVSSSGIPQGGVLSPLLANIVMDRFDKWIVGRKLTFDTGKRKRQNPEYSKMLYDVGQVDHARKVKYGMPSDEKFKRLVYVRYADDFIIGVHGSHDDCIELREQITTYLKSELNLDLNQDKTKITHAVKGSALFLGYKIHCSNIRKDKVRYLNNKTVRVASRPLLSCPTELVIKRLFSNGYCKVDGKPTRRGRLIHFEPKQIIEHYNLLERGILGYYVFCDNHHRVVSWVHYILKYSCVLTLGAKLKLKTKKKVFRRFGKNLTVKSEKGKPLVSYIRANYVKSRKFPKEAVYNVFGMIDKVALFTARSKQMLNKQCSICGSEITVEIHHVRHIRKGKDDSWILNKMRAMNRKQLPVCRECHRNIHSGAYDGLKLRSIAE